jgi:hypothetical protein
LAGEAIAERGYIDDVIMPHASARIARALAILRGKTVEMPGRKHDNLPVRGLAVEMRVDPIRRNFYFRFDIGVFL